MMQQMAGRFGLPGARAAATKKGKKGKKGKGRGPTQPKVRGGLPGGFPGRHARPVRRCRPASTNCRPAWPAWTSCRPASTRRS